MDLTFTDYQFEQEAAEAETEHLLEPRQAEESEDPPS